MIIGLLISRISLSAPLDLPEPSTEAEAMCQNVLVKCIGYSDAQTAQIDAQTSMIHDLSDQNVRLEAEKKDMPIYIIGGVVLGLVVGGLLGNSSNNSK
jgi:hypothetical protein